MNRVLLGRRVNTSQCSTPPEPCSILHCGPPQSPKRLRLNARTDLDADTQFPLPLCCGHLTISIPGTRVDFRVDQATKARQIFPSVCTCSSASDVPWSACGKSHRFGARGRNGGDGKAGAPSDSARGMGRCREAHVLSYVVLPDKCLDSPRRRAYKLVLHSVVTRSP